MRLAKIPKRNGTYRIVAVPSKTEQAKLDALLPRVTRVMERVCSTRVHGFYPCRSPVTNARAHVGYAHSVCFDLKDFFDCVTVEKLRALQLTTVDAMLNDPEFGICFIDGVAKQGLSTSPAWANIAASALDALIERGLNVVLARYAYTRYADDLTVSVDASTDIDVVKALVEAAVLSCGYQLAKQKTAVYSAKGGLRKITGVCVDGNTVLPSRESKRKLRAAKHQGNTSSAAGLTEWMKLKSCDMPGTPYYNICMAANLKPRLKQVPIETRSVRPTVGITNDPAVILGFSRMMSRGAGKYSVEKGYARYLYNLAHTDNVYLAYLTRHSSPLRLVHGAYFPIMDACALLIKVDERYVKIHLCASRLYHRDTLDYELAQATNITTVRQFVTERRTLLMRVPSYSRSRLPGYLLGDNVRAEPKGKYIEYYVVPDVRIEVPRHTQTAANEVLL